MNDSFLIKLRAVRWKSSEYPNAANELEVAYNNILKTINEYQLKSPFELKRYAVNSYNQITKEQKRIAEIYDTLQKTDLTKLDSVALNKYQAESDYYHTVLTNTDDARAAFIEYLVSYYPDEFNTESKIEILTQLLPFNPLAKSTIKEWYENQSLDSQQPQKETLPPVVQKESQFSVLEWATIFYYADETKLLPEIKTVVGKMKYFMKQHNIKTTPDNFKTKFYDAKRRINNKNDYPIAKLDEILPFLKSNYPLSVSKVENDKVFLKEESTDY